jgi:DNA polymerase-1
MLNISVDKAKALRDLYFSKLGKVSLFINNVKRKIDERSYIFNFAGRILHFPVIEFEKDGVKRSGNFAYKGPNYIIQSSGSEIMRGALILVHEFLLNFKSKLVLSIHDEILLEIAEDELHLIPRIQELMVQVYTPKNGLPMSTSVAIGESWGKLEDVNEDDIAKRIDVQKASSFPSSKAPLHNHVYNPANLDSRNS